MIARRSPTPASTDRQPMRRRRRERSPATTIAHGTALPRFPPVDASSRSIAGTATQVAGMATAARGVLAAASRRAGAGSRRDSSSPRPAELEAHVLFLTHGRGIDLQATVESILGRKREGGAAEVAARPAYADLYRRYCQGRATPAEAGLQQRTVALVRARSPAKNDPGTAVRMTRRAILPHFAPRGSPRCDLLAAAPRHAA